MNYINLKGDYHYTLILTKLNGDAICEIPEDYMESIEIKLDDFNKLNLTIPKYATSLNGTMILNPIYKEIKQNMIIEVNDKYKFIVGDIDIKQDSKKRIYKSITANSSEKSLQKKSIITTGDMFQLISDSVNIAKGVLEIFAEETGWKIGYIDEDARIEHHNGGTNNKYRWFDPTDSNWYNFLKETVAPAFDCVFVFDSFTETIHTYAKKNLGEHKGFNLDITRLAKNILRKEVSESVVTRLFVKGRETEDGYVGIEEENPLGTNYIENFDSMIENDILSEELVNALTRHKVLLDAKQLEWQIIKNEKSELSALLITKNSEILAKQEEIRGKEALLTAYIKAKSQEDIDRISAELEVLKAEHNVLLSDKTTLENQIKAKQDLTITIANQIDRKNATDNQGKIFSAELLEELNRAIIEDTWTNDYYLTAFTLYTAAQDVLKEKNKIQIDYDVESVDFLSTVKHPIGWDNILIMGDYVTVTDDEYMVDLRFVGYNHSPKSKSLKLYLTNKEQKHEYGKGYAGTNRKASQSKGLLDYYKHIFVDSKDTNNFVYKMRNDGLALVGNQIINARNSAKNKINIDETGIWLEDVDTGGLVYIGSGLIALSPNGRDFKTALDCNGLIADTIIGRMILGENMVIASETGIISIDGSGMIIKDELGRVRVKLGVYDSKAGLTMYDKNGGEVVLSEDGIVQRERSVISDNLDPNYPINIYLPIDDGVKSIKSVKLYIKLENYRTYEKQLTSEPTRFPSSGASSSTSSGASSTSTSGTGGYYDASGVSQSWGSPTYVDSFSSVLYLVEPVQGGYQGVNVKFNDFRHTHPIVLPNHAHSMQHTHDISHYHQVEISGHTHPIERGIFVGDKASNIDIYVNGVKANPMPINSDFFSIELAPHLIIGDNNISITSATMGRISGTLQMKTFAYF